MSQIARSSRRTLPVLVAAVSALVLVASLVVAGVMFSKHRDYQQAQDSSADALNAAEQFALRMDAFDGGNIDAYTKSIAPLLTTRQKTLFDQQLKQFAEVYEEAKKAGSADTEPGKGRIQLSGVTDADTDSATVLVAHDSTIPGQAESLHFRWQLSLRKIDGKWLVDDFVPVS